MKKRAISMLLAMLLAFVGVIPAAGLNVSAASDDKSQNSEPVYVDVPEGAWFYDAVAYMNAKGYMIGMDATHFRPEGVLTRGQFVTILHRLDGAPQVAYSPRFSDVPENQWYTTAILWAEENGVVKGYGNGLFGVSDLITREQMVLMMHRYVSGCKGLELEGGADLSDFSDAERVSSYALDAMSWAVFQGLIQGSATAEGVKLLPAASATRAQCAAIIQRFMAKMETERNPDKENELPMIPVD